MRLQDIHYAIEFQIRCNYLVFIPTANMSLEETMNGNGKEV